MQVSTACGGEGVVSARFGVKKDIHIDESILLFSPNFVRRLLDTASQGVMG